MSNYYKKQEAKVKLANILAEHGFTIYGFTEDRSDSMTDLWLPAHWDGVAERDGFVVVVDVYRAEYSGGRKRLRYENGRHIPYIEPWPTYQANPPRTNWHVEKDGVILAKGNGLVAANNDEDKLQRIVSRILQACETTSEPKNVDNTQTVEGVTVTLNDDKNGVEIRFATKPSPGIIAMLKGNGFRWSSRGFWYAQQTPERIKLAQSLASVADTPQDPHIAKNIQETETTPESQTATPTHDNVKKVQITVTRFNFRDTFTIPVDQLDNVTDEIERRYPHLANGDYAYSRGNYTDFEYVPPKQAQTFAPDQRVPMSRIIIKWSECGIVKGGEMFTTWDDANAFIRRIEREHDDNGGYFKTAFVVYFADGHTYEGRIDVNSKDNDLVKHIRQYVEFHAGVWKPAHMTQEEYDAVINGWAAEYVEPAREFLARYIIGDEPTTPDDKNKRDTSKRTAQVIDFTLYRAKSWLDKLTPEQRLKLHMVTQYLGHDVVSYAITAGITVDDMFRTLAQFMDAELTKLRK
jgi:hypothetical protein